MFKKTLAVSFLVLTLGFHQLTAQEFTNESIKVGESAGQTINCLVYKPANYSTSKQYALVLYFHGLGEAGTDINKLYATGLPKVLKDGYKPSMEFIMIAPQDKSYSMDPAYLSKLLDESMIKFPNIDPSRVYLTGVSEGGSTVYGSQTNVDTVLSKRFAAMAVMSGAAQNVNAKNYSWWKISRTPVWAVVGYNDISYREQNKYLVNQVNKLAPGSAAITIRQGIGHGGWNDVYSGSVKTENGNTVWEWLQQYSRDGATVSAAGIVSAAAVAATQRVLIDLGATATNTDQWGKYWNNMNDARPGIRISNAKTTTNTASTIGLEVLTRIDGTFSPSGKGVGLGTTTGIVEEYGASTTSDFAFAHKTATAGKWKIFGLDATKTYTIKFWGTKTASPNYFVQIKRSDETAWKEYNATKNKNYNTAASFSITGKSEMVFDIKTKTGSDFGYISVVDITIGGGTGGDTDPLPGTSFSANAGIDKTITLPTSSIALSGSAGTGVVSYKWTKSSGPTQFTINNANIYNPTISNLVAGSYIFRLTATNNAGTSAVDDVKISVLAPPTGTATSHILQFNAEKDAYYPNALGLNWKPGDTVFIPAGTYDLLDLGNIRGTAAKPIIIMNKGGLVTLNQVRLNNKMEYFKILGNGAPGITYGIKVNNTTKQIAFAAAMVSDMEIAYVEVSKGAIGMIIKKNPVANDPSTQYPNYLIKNIKIHHNYIHDIDTEGMYIGSTSPSGTADGIPIRLQNVEVYNNTVMRTGWDGIQMSCAIGTNSIHDNVIKDFGLLNASSQQTGIAIGGGATGDIYNNTISNGTGWGINAMGYGTMRIYNNLVENVGANGIGKGAESIYADDRITGPETHPKQQMIITGNTIKYPQPDGAIRVGAYNGNSLPSTVSNNIVYLPNALTNWLTFYVVSHAVGSIISGNTVIR
jgi:hypothetical protein